MITIILYIFIGLTIIQIVYYLGVFGKFSFARKQKTKSKNISISVIVRAKNKEEDVTKYIPLLAKQDYPDFEIILIDDASIDNTLAVFEEFEKQYKNVRLVKVENNEAFWGNKKYALTLGIKAARKEYLLFINANCYPVSKNWISSMSSKFSEKKTIVLGYSKYEKINRSFLNKIIRFESLINAIQYLSWAKIGNPYMGKGSNMGYKKTEFFNVNGFIEHIQVRAGADELFINQAANETNTAINDNLDSFTCSKPPTSFRTFFLSKKLQATTFNHFKIFDKLQLSIFYISQLLFILIAGILFSYQYEWITVLSILLIRYIVAWTVVGSAAWKVKENDLIFWFPIVEIIIIFTQVTIFILNLFSKPADLK